MNMYPSLGCLVLLSVASSMAHSATIEKPIYTQFKGSPAESNIVMGYVQFGQLADGSPAVQKVSARKVRFFTRIVFPKMGGNDSLYSAEELDCISGQMNFIGLGVNSTERITAIDDAPAPQSVVDTNAKNHPVYREVCSSLDIAPKF